MMPLRTSAILAAAAVAPLIAGLAAIAPAAAEPRVPTFGQHVSSCAQDMGFDGHHNPGHHSGHHPGHHRGASGWEAEGHC